MTRVLDQFKNYGLKFRENRLRLRDDEIVDNMSIQNLFFSHFNYNPEYKKPEDLFNEMINLALDCYFDEEETKCIKKDSYGVFIPGSFSLVGAFGSLSKTFDVEKVTFIVEHYSGTWIVYKVKDEIIESTEPFYIDRYHLKAGKLLFSWIYKIFKENLNSNEVSNDNEDEKISEKENEVQEVKYNMYSQDNYLDHGPYNIKNSISGSDFINVLGGLTNEMKSTVLPYYIFGMAVSKFNKENNSKFLVNKETIYDEKDVSRKIYLFNKKTQKDLFKELTTLKKQENEIYFVNRVGNLWVFGHLKKDWVLQQSEIIKFDCLIYGSYGGYDIVLYKLDKMLEKLIK